MAQDPLYDVWGRRNPQFETRFEEILLRKFTEYGGGSVESMSSKGKIFGAGYELYIYAFYLGLYSNFRKTLKGDCKVLGQPIQFWGNVDSKKFRKGYSRLRDYMFVHLIAKSDDIDLIALEKGEITERKAVDFLIQTMEEYANGGFYLIEEKLLDDPNYFYKNIGFLEFMLKIVSPQTQPQDDALEEL